MSEIILAIETSCDETSVALMENGKLLHCFTDTQIPTFIEYGGVVPEIAARMHEQMLPNLITKALKEIPYENITHIAYTAEPGLKGPLLVGKIAAETLALYGAKMLLPINHLHGHIVSPNLTGEVKYPALGLIVSGGHTQLIKATSASEFEVLSNTLDDAIGECYDKVARMLKLPYPGGPQIDRLAKTGEDVYKLPRPNDDGTLNFSFSGLKSATLNLLNKMKMKEEAYKAEDVATSFQVAAIDVIITKTKLAWSQDKYNSLFVAGGVSANSFLRDELVSNFDNVVLTDLKYTGDNAAMIALAAHYQINK